MVDSRELRAALPMATFADFRAKWREMDTEEGVARPATSRTGGGPRTRSPPRTKVIRSKNGQTNLRQCGGYLVEVVQTPRTNFRLVCDEGHSQAGNRPSSLVVLACFHGQPKETEKREGHDEATYDCRRRGCHPGGSHFRSGSATLDSRHLE